MQTPSKPPLIMMDCTLNYTLVDLAGNQQTIPRHRNANCHRIVRCLKCGGHSQRRRVQHKINNKRTGMDNCQAKDHVASWRGMLTFPNNNLKRINFHKTQPTSHKNSRLKFSTLQDPLPKLLGQCSSPPTPASVNTENS
ncbi:hypothetical protein CEXT_388041 [Caerostris extrusa]|uniref:Uncharacterized protein n=1 Tax=Caerostris extrusa TaxID=172846 RepID=A0AAV4XFV0_CAEEX|nr:hypothetical protein CEXT_388041 [Caerostris extrusa]